MSRIFAIIHDDPEQFGSNIEKLKAEFGKLGEVKIFSKNENEGEPALRNRINREIKSSGFDGFLHVVSESTGLLADVSGFIGDLENAMKKLDYAVWFNTVCDECNYVYDKYNPRVTVQMDAPECGKLGLSSNICFTSHSNTQWICYDMSAANDNQLTFSEEYTVPMFWIIEFLARRRNEGKSTDLYFMNQYMTVSSEKGVFKALGSSGAGTDPKTMQAEDALFKSKNIDYSVDNNVDMILDRLWNKILSKIPENA